MNKIYFLSLLIIVVLCSCARPFAKPDITVLPFEPTGSMLNNLDLDVSGGEVLKTPVHDKFQKKAAKKDLQLVVLRVNNFTDKDISFDKEQLTIISESDTLQPLKQKNVYKILRQNIWPHAFWFLVGPLVKEHNDKVIIDYHPVGAAFASWGLLNMAVAYHANKEVKDMLQLTSGNNQLIYAGTTSYIILGFKSKKPIASPKVFYGRNLQNKQL